MFDYRVLPPVEISVQPEIGKPQCQRCFNFPSFTYSLTYADEFDLPFPFPIYHEVCSPCLALLPDIPGMTSSRNKMAEPEKISSVYGADSFFSLVRNVQDFGQGLYDKPVLKNDLPQTNQYWDDKLKGYVTDEPSPGTYFVKDGYHTHEPPKRGYVNVVGPGGSGGTSARRPSVAGGGGGSYIYDDDVAYPKPKFGDSPGVFHDYIVRNYSAQQVRENYSDIKQRLMYPKPDPVTVTIPKTDNAESDDLSVSEFIARTIDLTEAKQTDTLVMNAETPENKETEVPMRSILSKEEAEAAYKQAAAALAEVERLDQKYTPELPDGSVIAFNITFPSNSGTFSYAVIRATGKWFPTGRVHPSFEVGVGLQWAQLLSALETFKVSDFEVLRTGGTANALEAAPQDDIPEGAVHRVAEVPDDKRDAFCGPQVTTAAVVESRYDDDEFNERENDAHEFDRS